jgi:iron complex outermembrane recepter protein
MELPVSRSSASNTRFGRLLVSTAAVALLTAGAQPAFAQGQADRVDTPTQDPVITEQVSPVSTSSEAPAPSDDEIVVTGSRIARRDYEANSPIVTVNETLLEQSSTVAIESNLNKLPQFAPAQNQFVAGDIQPTSTNTPGTASIALRNIGANRTLVLLDGRRATPANALGIVDINSIPAGAVERVEIITGGASATYGADAVGGVTNFILKKNFQGLELDGQFGITERGDSREYRVSAFTGANFDDGRGNVILGVEHMDRGKAKRIDRDFFRDFWADPQTAGTEFFPDYPFYTIGGRGDNFPSPAAIAQVCPGATPPPSPFFGTFQVAPGTGTVWGGMGLFGGTSVGCAFKFPFEIDGLKHVISANGTIEQNWLEELASLPMDRWTAFGRAEYEFNDNLAFFSQAYFTRSHSSTSQQPAPAGNQWGASIPHGDNTVYTTAAGAPLTPAQAAAAGLVCANMAACTRSEVFPTPTELDILLDSRGLAPVGGPAGINSEFDWQLSQYLNFIGNRDATTDVFTYQFLGGFRGDIPGLDWTWEVYGSHGQTRTNGNLTGFGSLARYRAIVTAPNYGMNFVGRGNTQFGGFAGATATCTSGLNPFDNIPTSEDCVEAIHADIRTRQDTEQSVWEATLQGGLFELPGGEVRFALGADYRRNRFEFLNDTLTLQGASFLDQAIGLFPSGETKGTVRAQEVYGELLIPLLGDLPFVESLNLELGGRYSDYNTTGGSFTWKALGDWEVTDWFRFRGGYNKAERSPNVGELFQALQQVFAVAGRGDVCSINNQTPWGANPATNPNSAAAVAICTALMTPQGAANFYGNPANQGAGFAFVFQSSTGNPDLTPEVAKTWTVGAVLQSPLENPWFRRLRLSADYYNIRVDDAIAGQTADVAQQACFDVAFNPTFDPTAPACLRLTRDPNQGTISDIGSTFTNDGRFRTDGLDVQLDWNVNFEDAEVGLPGSINLNVLFNYLFNIKSATLPTNPLIDYAGTLGPVNGENGLNAGAYEWRTFSTLTYATGPGTLSFEWQHAPKTKSITAATNPDTAVEGSPAYDLFNLHATFAVTPSIIFRAGVDNLFDKAPPIIERNSAPPAGTLAGGAIGTGINGGIFDLLGRRFYAGIKATW